MTRYSLIMLQTPLVAHDLSLCLEELTGTQCITCAAADEACERLAELQTGALHCAFIQSDFESLKGSPLLARVTALGGHIVLIGHSAELEVARSEPDALLPVLMQPFGLAQVAEVLSRISSASPHADPSPTLP